MRLDIAAQTDIGRRKAKNEDSCGVFLEGDPEIKLFQEGALACVADGLGGHAGGEIASKLAVSIIKEARVLKPPAENTDNDDEVDESSVGPLPILRTAMHRANESIFQTNQDLLVAAKGSGDGKARPMGTTLLSAIIEPRKAYICNVGDSRCYHIRDGEIIDMTEDHSWVDEQVKLGLMSKAEAETDRRKNIVTRCIGTHEEIEVDAYLWHIVPGDQLLLCTDGLVNMVPDKDIVAEFRRSATSAEIAQRLVSMANENGGKDNITVVVAHISPSPMRHLFLQIRALFRRGGITPKRALLLLIYGLICGGIGYALQLVFPLVAQ